jgi:hypothetical protein
MMEIAQNAQEPSIIGIEYDRRLVKGLDGILATDGEDKKKTQTNLKQSIERK